MNTRLFLFCLLFFTLSFTKLSSQEQLGLRLDNYSGVNGIVLNPAANLTSPFRFDINLISAGVFADNNYGHIRNTNLFHFIKNSQDESNLIDAVNTPNDIRIPLGEAIDIAPTNVAGMVWSEFGINFAPAFFTYNGKFSLGITAKYLTGYEAAFAETPNTLQITQFPGDSLQLENGLINFGFTDSNTNSDIDPAVRKNGQGFSFDVGAVMTIEGDDDGYIWRLGASILDIGQITFSKNAQFHQIDQPTDSLLGILPIDDYDGFADLSDYVNLLSSQTLGNSLASRVGDRFSIGLPTALSLQADYQFYPDFYVNATLVQRLKFTSLVRHRIRQSGKLGRKINLYWNRYIFWNKN